MSERSASLAMYPFHEVRSAYEQLWDRVVERCPGLPPTLAWPDDVPPTWVDDDVVVKQACGWPLVTQLGDKVRVVGAFRHDLPEAVGHRYRSTVVATRGGTPDDFSAATVAYNSSDSLSGWVSLVAWSGRSGDSLRDAGVESGSHAASLELLRDRRVELASVDSITLALVRRHRPDLLSGVVVVGHGPLVPSLPVIVPATAGHPLVHRLRDVFASVVADDETTRDALLVSGFEALDLDDYRHELAELVELIAA